MADFTNCLLTGGYDLGCKDNTGGIQKVYIRNFSDEVYTYDTDGSILTVLDAATGLVAPTYYTFEQRNENAEFTQEGQHSVENGTNFWIQTINLIFHKNEADLRNTLLVLAKSSLDIVVLDQNGTYWQIGKQNGAELVSSTSNMGKAYGDMNGSTVGIEGREPEPADVVSAAAFATFTIL